MRRDLDGHGLRFRVEKGWLGVRCDGRCPRMRRFRCGGAGAGSDRESQERFPCGQEHAGVLQGWAGDVNPWNRSWCRRGDRGWRTNGKRVVLVVGRRRELWRHRSTGSTDGEASTNDVCNIALDVVGAEVYFPGLISRAKPVAAGSGSRSEGVTRACGGAIAVRGLTPLELWTDAALLFALDTLSSSARNAKTDVVPGRLHKAPEQAARLLEPKVRPIRSSARRSRPRTTSTHGYKKAVIAAIQDGPVLVR